MNGGRRAVFLDRDGVLNRSFVRSGKPYPPATMAEFEVFPWVPEACARLAQASLTLIVVTNQPDVATGAQQRDLVEAMHSRLMDELPLDDIKVCFHTDADGCSCRKPRPGLLQTAANEHGISLKDSFMVGDRWRDIDCGRSVGCFSIYVNSGHSEPLKAAPDAVCSDLGSAAALILRQVRHCTAPHTGVNLR